MLRLGEWVRVRRTHESLERGGVSPEGASIPRARRSLARGGVQPSSEAEFRRYDAGPSSKAEFRPRGAGADRLMGPCPLRLPGPWAAVTRPWLHEA
jgi:hypothetical protein